MYLILLLHTMKNLPTIISSFVIFLFISCGSENVTNQNPGTGEEVIFSMDSFAINLENFLTVKDTNILITNAPNVKITFKCSTNADSLNSYAQFRVSVTDSNSVYLDTVNNHISSLNRNFIFQSNASNHSIVRFFLQASRTNSNSYFLSLTEIKIIRV